MIKPKGSAMIPCVDETLIEGNCLVSLPLMPSDSIDLILTDPPYNLGGFMNKRDFNLARMRNNTFVGAGWDNGGESEWKQLMLGFFEQASRVLRPGGSVIIFMSIIRIESCVAMAQEWGLYYKTTGIWHKTNPMPRNMHLQYVNSTEPWMYLTKKHKTGTFNNHGKAIHDFIETSVTPARERRFGKHPTQKPIALMRHFIETLSNAGDHVLDPFMGSGSTGVASKQLSRKFTGIELDNSYYNMAADRMGAESAWIV